MSKRPQARRFKWWRRPVGSRRPQGSGLYGRLLLAVIVLMAIVMAALILFAIGVLVGVVPFR